MLSKWLPCCFVNGEKRLKDMRNTLAAPGTRFRIALRTQSISAVEFVQGWHRRMRGNERTWLNQPRVRLGFP